MLSLQSPARRCLPLVLLVSSALAHALDSDRDRMSNQFEIQHGFLPFQADQNGNGILDGQDDADGDGLGNAAEEAAGTDPRVADTDGDGLTDREELQPATLETPVGLGAAPLGMGTVTVADVDGDGDPDIIGGSENPPSLVLFENDRPGERFVERLISDTLPRVFSVTAADLDGDGDVDLLTAGAGVSGSIFTDHLAWFENLDGLGTFSAEQLITATVDAPRTIIGVDIDGDGDRDILTGDFGDGTRWYSNTDGLGTFGPQQTISTDTSGIAVPVDFDGDGDIDVLASRPGSGSSVTNEIVLIRQTGLSLPLWSTPQVISTETDTLRSIAAADMDADGDPDVLFSSNDRVGWFENAPGAVPAVPGDFRDDVFDGLVESVLPLDHDGDGDLDIVFVTSAGDLWVTRNTDGAGALGRPRLLASGMSTNTSTNPLAAGDFDGSGEPDIVVANDSGSESPVWVTRATRTSSPLLADTDGDGLEDGYEVGYGTNPQDDDQNGNGVIDGLDDPDGDGLDNLAEQDAGTDPTSDDTDGDGVDDGTELVRGSDPLVPDAPLQVPTVSPATLCALAFGLVAIAVVITRGRRVRGSHAIP